MRGHAATTAWLSISLAREVSTKRQGHRKKKVDNGLHRLVGCWFSSIERLARSGACGYSPLFRPEPAWLVVATLGTHTSIRAKRAASARSARGHTVAASLGRPLPCCYFLCRRQGRLPWSPMRASFLAPKTRPSKTCQSPPRKPPRLTSPEPHTKYPTNRGLDMAFHVTF